MDKRTNDWVLKNAGTEPFLLQSVKKIKLSYYGHVLRKEGNCMEKEIMQSAILLVKQEEEDQEHVGRIT